MSGVTTLGTTSERTSWTGSDCIYDTATMPTARAAYNGGRPIMIKQLRAYISGRGASRTGRLFIGTSVASAQAISGSMSFPSAGQASDTGWENIANYTFSSSGFAIAYGAKSMSGSFYFARGGSGEARSCDGQSWGTRLYFQFDWAEVPSAPGVSSVSPNGNPGECVVIITAPSANGGETILTYTHQFSTNSSFTAVVKEQQSGSGTTTFSGLPTGVTLYHRVMAVNSVSNAAGLKGGAASVTTSFSLGSAPVDAPSVAVTAAPSGLSASLLITPPTDTGGLPITGYNIEYNRTLPTTGSTVSLTSAGTSLVVSGLTPGATYRYRVQAVNSVGTSPWSAYTTRLQPNPSTNPGDYFDGSSAATDDQSYAWTGTTNNSTSIAVGHAATGWQNFASGIGASGATGVVARVTGGASLPSGMTAGAFAARATIFTDATGAGFYVGTYAGSTPGRATVIAGQTYTSSIYVRLSRTNRVAAQVRFHDTSGTFISAAIGPEIVVPAGIWTRLSVTADAPALTVYAGVSVIDVAGTGHVNWQGGDTIVVDAAMISLGADLLSYFDGSFVDDANYAYSWTGTANASTSLREDIAQSAYDPLADPDCPPIPLPPRPPIVLDDCIEDVGIWRRYWVSIPSGNVSDWLTTLPTLILSTGAFAVRQVRIRVYPNPFNYSVADADTSNWCSEQIVSYIPPNTVFTLDGPLQRVFAEVNGGASIPADHLLYGTGGVPATWPALSCGISYLASFDVPLDAPLENFTQPQVLLTRRT